MNFVIWGLGIGPNPQSPNKQLNNSLILILNPI